MLSVEISRCLRLRSRCNTAAVSLPGSLPVSLCSTQRRCLRKHQSVSNMGRNAHVRVPIHQQQLAIKQQAKQSTNDLTRESSTDEAPSKPLVEALALCELVDHLNSIITSTTSTIRQEQLNEIVDICINDLRQTARYHSHRNHTRVETTLAENPWNDKPTIAPCAIKPTDATWGAHSATAHPDSAAASSACSAAACATDAVFAHEQRLDPPPPPLLPPPVEQC